LPGAAHDCGIGRTTGGTYRVAGVGLTDKVAVITGGSRGIGRATAIAAAARGFRVVVGYANNKAAADEVVAMIEARNGKAIAVKCDVAEETDILELFKAADKFGTLGALVNNGGIVGR
jgi:NAD(P)-dependent dehydrogenase (short-subunit alcohol dehydrogenase family)